MPFLPAGVGSAIAGGVAAGAVGVVGSAIAGSGQSGAISQGQSQANAALAPYSTTGAQADTQTANLLGLNGQAAATSAMGAFQASPGYQYQVQQGLQAVDAGAASKGMLTSGSTIKAEQTLGSNLANQDFGNYVSRLNSLSNYGITAAGGQASADTSAAGAQSSIYGNEVKGVSNTIGMALNDSGVRNSLSGLFGSSNSGVDTGSFFS